MIVSGNPADFNRTRRRATQAVDLPIHVGKPGVLRKPRA